MALHLNAVDYKICNRESRSSDSANAVWITSMSWSSASFMSGMVCSRTSLTRRSTSEERGLKRAYVHRDDILNNRIIEGTLVWKRLSNICFSQNNVLHTAKYVNFRVLCFPMYDSCTNKVRWGKWNYLSITHCLSNKYTKNYCNRTILVEVIAEDVVAYFFLKHGVFI